MMNETKTIRMRFVIDKSSPVGFVDQLVASIRRAIERRELKAGDLLPGFRQIAAELDVSLRVPRDAVARLVKEGVLSARRGFGTTVVGKGGSVRPRRVLVLHQETGGYFYLNRIFEIVCMRLLSEGMTVVREAVPYLVRGEKAVRGVRTLLEREHFDCALVMLYEDDYFELLDRFGVPYVASALLPKRYSGASGLILNSLRTAAKSFAADCLKKKVRRVLQVSHIFDVLNLKEFFQSADIEIETLDIPVKSWEKDYAVALQMKTRELLGKRLDRGNWPDVVFLFDDYVARGGLLALYERSVRFPEDLGVVVWSNRGDDVLSFKRLTSMVMDVESAANKISNDFLRFVRTGSFPKGVTLGPSYVRGDSF